MATQSDTTLPVGSLWEIPGAVGKPAEITRPDGVAVVVTDGVHALSLPGEYVAQVGRKRSEITAVAPDADPA